MHYVVLFSFLFASYRYTRYSWRRDGTQTRAAAEIVMGNQPGSTPLAEAKPAGRDLVKGQYCN
jgi:hypothetical protein